MRLSIVVPALNEAESIGPLLREIAAVADRVPVADVIIVDDGSTDDTCTAVINLKPIVPGLRLVRHLSRRGQSTAIRTGISRATGELVVTLDGDGQNDPADIPLLFETYMKAAVLNPRVLVAGQRLKRQDNAVRRCSSRIANGVRAAILDDGVADTGCSLKLFRGEDFLALPFFNHIHRFIPALMKATGVEVVLVGVSHRARQRGVSKYGTWDRLWVGIHDLFGVSWLMRRTPPKVDIEEAS